MNSVVYFINNLTYVVDLLCLATHLLLSLLYYMFSVFIYTKLHLFWFTKQTHPLSPLLSFQTQFPAFSLDTNPYACLFVSFSHYKVMLSLLLVIFACFDCAELLGV